MRVILFQIGDYAVRSYGVIVVLAVLLAAGVAYYLTKGTAYRKHVSDLILYIMIGALIGARLWAVAFFHGAYYAQHPGEILAFWQGGLSVQGGLTGGFLAGLLYTRRHRLSFWEFADLLAPAIILGQAVGRIACLLNGDAFGSPTNLGFGLVYPAGTIAYDTYGAQPLWPAEVFEMQWDLIGFALLILLKNRAWPKGFIFLAYNLFYSLGRFMLEFLRGDSPRYAMDWTAGQWTSVTVITISLALMIFIFTNRKWRESGVPPKTEAA